MFESVLVANRGEIARRVIRTLERMGVRSVAIYTDADATAPHVRDADEAVRVSSYLAIEEIVAVARGRADAVHPGYGFLSENAAFARACTDVTFIGPSADAIELMGDKVRAKEAAARAGVPVVESLSLEEARVSDAYPLLVKAAAGGGGRGMRVVEAPAALDDAIAAARREAAAGFGDDRVFIERFLPRAAHRGPGHRGQPRQRLLAGRARMHAAAPPPEGARGVAVAGRLAGAARPAGGGGGGARAGGGVHGRRDGRVHRRRRR